MTPKDVLVEMRRLIEEVGGTQDYDALDQEGEAVDPCSEVATCFCLGGALHRAEHGGNAPHSVRDEVRLLITDAIGEGYIPNWNDRRGRTKEEVLQALDIAIEKSAQFEK